MHQRHRQTDSEREREFTSAKNDKCKCYVELPVCWFVFHKISQKPMSPRNSFIFGSKVKVTRHLQRIGLQKEGLLLGPPCVMSARPMLLTAAVSARVLFCSRRRRGYCNSIGSWLLVGLVIVVLSTKNLQARRKTPSTRATMWKQRSTFLPVASTLLLRHSCWCGRGSTAQV